MARPRWLPRTAEHLATQQSAEHHSGHVQRLAGGQWFTSRVSACGLFATAYGKATPAMRVQLRSLFRTLSTDDTPMVRRAAASNLGKFGATVEPDNLAKDLLPQFQALSMDGELGLIKNLAHHCRPAYAHPHGQPLQRQ